MSNKINKKDFIPPKIYSQNIRYFLIKIVNWSFAPVHFSHLSFFYCLLGLPFRITSASFFDPSHSPQGSKGNASSALVTWVTRHHTSNALILFRYLFADPLIVMESPNTEYRSGFESRLEKDQQLSDQYKSMRDLLKVYGLSVAEDNHSPQEGKTLKRAPLIGCIHFLNPFMCGREQCKR